MPPRTERPKIPESKRVELEIHGSVARTKLFKEAIGALNAQKGRKNMPEIEQKVIARAGTIYEPSAGASQKVLHGDEVLRVTAATAVDIEKVWAKIRKNNRPRKPRGRT